MGKSVRTEFVKQFVPLPVLVKTVEATDVAESVEVVSMDKFVIQAELVLQSRIYVQE
jgi:hypothetical protein